MKSQIICSNCIMDNTDATIVFDDTGKCEYCTNFYNNILPHWQLGEKQENRLLKIVEKIKKKQINQDYDCIIGISGGLDSSYLAYHATKILGLRPLLFHVDAGWNTHESTHNIKAIVDGLGLDLYTQVIDWAEMRDLQLSFIKAQVPDIDIPQDLVFFSSLYNYAAKNKIKYILTGGNFSTECVREPIQWGAYYATDLRYVNHIHKLYGTQPLVTLPKCDIFKYKFYYRFFSGVRMLKPLDSIIYNKSDAIKTLVDSFGWIPYKAKHHESRYTRFVEGYWLPNKFGYDRRKAHLSSLILTNQLTRKEALKIIETPEFTERFVQEEMEFVATKLGITHKELNQYFKGENKNFRDFKNKFKYINLGTRLMQFLGVEKRTFK